MRYGTEDPAAKAADDALIAHMFGEGDERPRNDDGPRMGNAEAEDLNKGALAEQPKAKSYTNPPGEASAFQGRRACAAGLRAALAAVKAAPRGRRDMRDSRSHMKRSGKRLSGCASGTRTLPPSLSRPRPPRRSKTSSSRMAKLRSKTTGTTTQRAARQPMRGSPTPRPADRCKAILGPPTARCDRMASVV